VLVKVAEAAVATENNEDFEAKSKLKSSFFSKSVFSNSFACSMSERSGSLSKLSLVISCSTLTCCLYSFIFKD